MVDVRDSDLAIFLHIDSVNWQLPQKEWLATHVALLECLFGPNTNYLTQGIPSWP